MKGLLRPSRELLSRTICELVNEPNLNALAMAPWPLRPLTNLARDQGVRETSRVLRDWFAKFSLQCTVCHECQQARAYQGLTQKVNYECMHEN